MDRLHQRQLPYTKSDINLSIKWQGCPWTDEQRMTKHHGPDCKAEWFTRADALGQGRSHQSIPTSTEIHETKCDLEGKTDAWRKLYNIVLMALTESDPTYLITIAALQESCEAKCWCRLQSGYNSCQNSDSSNGLKIVLLVQVHCTDIWWTPLVCFTVEARLLTNFSSNWCAISLLLCIFLKGKVKRLNQISKHLLECPSLFL